MNMVPFAPRRAVALGLLSLAAVSAQAATTLIYCSEGSPEGFDPARFTAGTTYNASSQPLFNRLVIMESTDKSFHGYKKINFPAGRSRRSIAAYGYSLVTVGSVSRHTTNWAPQEASAGKRALAKNWNWIVLTKNKFLGSGTLKNRQT